jgi:hypothetical protein
MEPKGKFLFPQEPALVVNRKPDEFTPTDYYKK